MTTLEAIGKVLIVGLIFGAGLPALFAVGLRVHAAGMGDANADGSVTAPNPFLKAVGYLFFAIVIAAIVFGILWITRQTLNYYFDIKIFPEWAYK